MTQGFAPQPRRRLRRRILLGLAAVLVVVFVVPERSAIPVAGATSASWNRRSFWYEPWGASGVHKGIDIFAQKGTPVRAPTDGLVLFRGTIALGGRVVVLVGPKLRLHYFAHLDSIDVAPLTPVLRGHLLGHVGDSGNAQGKPPHLHYAIVTPVPYPWRIDSSTQGWKKMFYLDPDAWLRNARARRLGAHAITTADRSRSLLASLGRARVARLAACAGGNSSRKSVTPLPPLPARPCCQPWATRKARAAKGASR